MKKNGESRGLGHKIEIKKSKSEEKRVRKKNMIVIQSRLKKHLMR